MLVTKVAPSSESENQIQEYVLFEYSEHTKNAENRMQTTSGKNTKRVLYVVHGKYEDCRVNDDNGADCDKI